MSRLRVRRRLQGAASQFGAPLSTGVKAISGGVLALLGVMMVMLPIVTPPQAGWAAVLGPGILGVILGVTALFCVRGFGVRQGELLIQRLFWQTRFSLRELRHAYPEADALKWSLRKAGNGGFLAYTGWFWSKRLGSFRAFVTDPARCVVLEFKDRKIVVSPEDPEGFLEALGFGMDSGRDRR